MSRPWRKVPRTKTIDRRNLCINCGFAIPRQLRRYSLEQATTQMINVLQSWITPTQLSPGSIICPECFGLLQNGVNTMSEGSAMPLPALGHRRICFPCGNSILRAPKTYPVRHDRQERNILMRLVPLHLVSRMEHACPACWRSATREVQKQQQHDSKHPTVAHAVSSEDFNIRLDAASTHGYSSIEVKVEKIDCSDEFQPKTESDIEALTSEPSLSTRLTFKDEEDLALGVDSVTPDGSYEDCVAEDRIGNTIEFRFSRKSIFEMWCTATGSDTQKHKHVMETVLALIEQKGNLDYVDIKNLDHKILNLCKSLHIFWENVARNESKFLHVYSDWLNVIESVDLLKCDEQDIQANADQVPESNPEPSCESGHLRRGSSESTEGSKRRRLSELSTIQDSAVNVPNTSPRLNISADEVLSMFVEARLTKQQYLIIQNFINNKTACDILPSYQNVMNAKNKYCLDDLIVSESECKIEEE